MVGRGYGIGQCCCSRGSCLGLSSLVRSPFVVRSCCNLVVAGAGSRNFGVVSTHGNQGTLIRALVVDIDGVEEVDGVDGAGDDALAGCSSEEGWALVAVHWGSLQGAWMMEVSWWASEGEAGIFLLSCFLLVGNSSVGFLLLVVLA